MTAAVEQREDEPMVHIPVIQLITETRKEIAAGFASVKAELVNKADKADLAEIRGELRGHAERLSLIESKLHTDEEKDLAVLRARECDEEARAKRAEHRAGRMNLWLSLGVLVAIALGVILPFVVH